MSSFSFQLQNISDLEFVDAVNILSTRIDVDFQMDFRLDGRGNVLTCPISQAKDTTSVAEVLDRNDEFFEGIYGTAGNYSISLTRPADGSTHFTFTSPDRLPEGEYARVNLAAREIFGQWKIRRLRTPATPETEEALGRQEYRLDRLEKLATRVTEETLNHRRRLDDEALQASKNQEAQFKQRLDEVNADFAARLAQLAEREQKLSDLQQSLDRKTNTDARRELRTAIKKALEIDGGFQLANSTLNSRKPVWRTFVFLIILVAAAFIWSAVQATDQKMDGTTAAWLAFVRPALSLAATVALTLYFIRWQDRWAQMYADEELRMMHLNRDIDRASWLVEMMLEWRTAAQVDVPKELTERLAAGLFESIRSAPLARHPVEEALAALLSSPAAVKVRLPGGDLDLTKKSVDQARAALAE